MKQSSLKEHNKKYIEFSKKAARGDYPSKKVAHTGSIVGMCIGVLLLLIGIVGIFSRYIWGFGSIVAGGVTCISNIINLGRLKSK